jgi:hypothetical protein
MRRSFAVIAAGAFTLGTLPAVAQTKPTVQKELVLELGPGELTPEFAEIIGKYGARSAYVGKKPETIADVVTAACGDLQPSFIRAVQIANGNDALRYETIVKAAEIIQLPPCPPRTGYVLTPQKVSEGDSAYAYYKGFVSAGPEKNLNFYNSSIDVDVSKINMDLKKFASIAEGLKAAQKAADLTPAGHGAPETTYQSVQPPKPVSINVSLTQEKMSWVQLFAAANPEIQNLESIKQDQIVVLPAVEEQVKYTLPLAATAPDNIAEVASRDPGLTTAAGREVKKTQLINGFQFFSSVENSDCKPSRQFDEAYENRVLRALVEDLSLSAGGGAPHPALVLLDSGVYNIANIPGSPRPTGLVVPYTGSPNEYAPFDELSEAAHGTGVLTLSVGGLGLATEGGGLGYRYDIQPINIFKKTSSVAFHNGQPQFDADGNEVISEDYNLDTEKITRALQFSGPAVVNMSFGRDTQIDELMDELKPTSTTLYIVAAGNDGEPLEGLDLYPGKNGGSSAPNLITVASVDGNNSLSKFSNKGSEYVEIAAPGCAVPTLSYDVPSKLLVTQPMTGTSFSAPQVSWVASMVRALLGPRTASVIKARVLIAADSNPGLAGDVAEGRILNPLKALSLTKDVIEIDRSVTNPSDKFHEVLRGTVPGTPDPKQFCDDATAPVISGAKLAKVVRNFDGGAEAVGKNRLYFVDANGAIKAKTCTARDFTLELQVDATADPRALKAKEIVDITFRWPQ